MLHGFLNINKSAGLTSHDVVARVRRLAGQKRVGHGGTLDPAATGVLPVGLGDATRLLEYLVEGTKQYQAVVRLGISTTTDDAEGSVVAEQPVPAFELGTLERALLPFVGVIQQVPPAFSAIQVNGQRMYDLARRGETPELAARPVQVLAIDVLAWHAPDLTLHIHCGKGTYIRAIARDLGRALGCGAHLAALQRRAVGPLLLDAAMTLETLQAAPERLAQALLPPTAALTDWPSSAVSSADATRLRNGLAVRLPQLTGPHAYAHDETGRLVALLHPADDGWRPFKVFGVGE